MDAFVEIRWFFKNMFDCNLEILACVCLIEEIVCIHGQCFHFLIWNIF